MEGYPRGTKTVYKNWTYWKWIRDKGVLCATRNDSVTAPHQPVHKLYHMESGEDIVSFAEDPETTCRETIKKRA